MKSKFTREIDSKAMKELDILSLSQMMIEKQISEHLNQSKIRESKLK